MADKIVIYRGFYVDHALACMHAGCPENAKSWIMRDGMYDQYEPDVSTMCVARDHIFDKQIVIFKTVKSTTENAQGAGI